MSRARTGRPGPLPLFHCACCIAATLVAKVATGRTAPRMPLAGTPSNGFGPCARRVSTSRRIVVCPICAC